MEKVDWITWKTDPSEIINPEEMNEILTEKFKNYDSYMNLMIYERLKDEVSSGGLTKDAFNVSGISPANEMAVDILNTIEEIKRTIVNLQTNINDIATKQKKIEKQQLIDAIEEKIRKEKVFLKNIEEKNTEKTSMEKEESTDDILYIIDDRIKKLNERLEQARSL